MQRTRSGPPLPLLLVLRLVACVLEHDDEDPDEDGDKVGEEGERVLDVVHVAVVRPLDDLLRVVHHVPQEDQQAKVDLKHEAARGVAKDGRGKLQPEQDRQAGGEQATEVQVLPALGDDGGAREAPEGDGGSDKPCHADAGRTIATSK